MSVIINLTEEEKEFLNDYVKHHSISLEEAFKNALFEKIEDEYDLCIAKEAYEEYVASDKESFPLSKVWESLNKSD